MLKPKKNRVGNYGQEHLAGHVETLLAHTLSWLHETKKSFAFQNNSVLIESVTSLPAQGLWRKKTAEYLLFIEGSLGAKICAKCFTFIVLAGLLGRSY